MSTVFSGFENLHIDDEIAFLELVEGYQSDFDNNMNHLDGRDDPSATYLSFMSKVYAAASGFDIEPFASRKLPTRNQVSEEFDDFNFALQRYVTGTKIRKTRGAKVYSVMLDSNTKRQIHFFLARIKDVVEKADLEERKKNSLFKKLNAFAADVDKSRTGFDNAMLMGIEVANLAKKFGEAIKPAADLMQSINELLGAAKAEEPEQQLPPPEARDRLSPPPKEITDEARRSRDLDDEAPF